MRAFPVTSDYVANAKPINYERLNEYYNNLRCLKLQIRTTQQNDLDISAKN